MGTHELCPKKDVRVCVKHKLSKAAFRPLHHRFSVPREVNDLRTVTLRPSALAASAVSPTEAISGSVKMQAGMADTFFTGAPPNMAWNRIFGLCLRCMGQLDAAGYDVPHRVNSGDLSPILFVHRDIAAFHREIKRCGKKPLGVGPAARAHQQAIRRGFQIAAFLRKAAEEFSAVSGGDLLHRGACVRIPTHRAF